MISASADHGEAGYSVDRSQAKLLFGQTWVKVLQLVHRSLFFQQTGNIINRDPSASSNRRSRADFGIFCDHLLSASQLFETSVHFIPKLLNPDRDRSRLLQLAETQFLSRKDIGSIHQE